MKIIMIIIIIKRLDNNNSHERKHTTRDAFDSLVCSILLLCQSLYISHDAEQHAPSPIPSIKRKWNDVNNKVTMTSFTASAPQELPRPAQYASRKRQEFNSNHRVSSIHQTSIGNNEQGLTLHYLPLGKNPQESLRKKPANHDPDSSPIYQLIISYPPVPGIDAEFLEIRPNRFQTRHWFDQSQKWYFFSFHQVLPPQHWWYFSHAHNHIYIYIYIYINLLRNDCIGFSWRGLTLQRIEVNQLTIQKKETKRERERERERETRKKEWGWKTKRKMIIHFLILPPLSSSSSASSSSYSSFISPIFWIFQLP